MQSLCTEAFHDHVPIRLTIDNGATWNMIRVACASRLCLKVSSSTLSARQADGSSPFMVVGDTHSHFLERRAQALFRRTCGRKPGFGTFSLVSHLWSVMTCPFAPLDIRSVTHMSMAPIGRMKTDMPFGELTFFCHLITYCVARGFCRTWTSSRTSKHYTQAWCWATWGLCTLVCSIVVRRCIQKN